MKSGRVTKSTPKRNASPVKKESFDGEEDFYAGTGGAVGTPENDFGIGEAMDEEIY